MNDIKCKNMMYTQQLDHLPVEIIEKLKNIIETVICPDRWAIILHDKDVNEDGTPEVPHVHVMMSFKNARHINSIAKLLNDEPQYIEVWRGNANNGYAYLVHGTDDAKNKYQYAACEVTANFDYSTFLREIGEKVAKAKTQRSAEITNMLDKLRIGSMTKEEVIGQLTGAEYARMHNQIDAVYALYLAESAQKWHDEMMAQGKQIKVIWLYGATGTGKTSWAKVLADKAGSPAYISGSSRDIFQNYEGQHTLIMDELRPEDIPYHDLLRMLDPFSLETSQVMAPARYRDKPLACDLIIITTPYDPLTFCRYMRLGSVDMADQLIRRLSLVIQVDDFSICEVTFDGYANNFVPRFEKAKTNPYSSLNRPQPASTPDLFNTLFTV